ncbi:Tetratricopeptide repeat-containing protein [Ectothiorhodospira magna]|uniref:Tetratricopeptide repeat-containing protein n=1 Tax=Ectothiorhodospira magna TaxID=867345 RepID=A0A1H9CM58_9GAMM|nr:response regulator [Ectothiorhodospira magna]SEQ02137.1 Tetratricopeptide repeat-containing protein [Ectothiorhodospira magna]
MHIALDRKTVLIVDDFQNMRVQLAQMLESLGFARQPDLASTANEALERLQRRRYDVILCDYNLGEGLHGQHILDLARREGWIDVATVFIMVTAENSAEMVMGALESGPDAYLAKPISKELLRARLVRALRRREPMVPVAQALRQGDTSQALHLLDMMLATGRGESADILRLKAELALETGDLALARQVCEMVIRERPPAWALTILGQVALHHQDLSAAETWFREAMVVTPFFMAAHDHLASVLEQQGRLQDALDVVEQAVARSWRSLSRQRRLGRLAMALEEWETGRGAWRQAIELARPLEEIRGEDFLNLIFCTLELGELARAAKILDDMRRSLSDDPALRWWSILGRLHLAVHDPDDKEAALDALDGIMLRALPPIQVHQGLIAVLLRLNEVTRAELLRQNLPT